jgi:uncharacterized protein YbjT (DUF2867 family)
MTATDNVASGASMSVPAVGQKRVVIVGATGMVGGYAVRFALDLSAVKSVTSIGRKRLGISHPKLNEVLHQDFADCTPLADVLSGQDAVVYCLGTYTGAVPDAELRKITTDYTADDLACAMMDVLLRQSHERQGLVFENRDIRAMVRSRTPRQNTK